MGHVVKDTIHLDATDADAVLGLYRSHRSQLAGSESKGRGKAHTADSREIAPPAAELRFARRSEATSR